MYINPIYSILDTWSNGEMDMNYKIYNFPTEEDGVHLVEKKLCELIVKYRENRNSLDPIEVDYMDWANSVIITAGNQ